MTMDQRERIIEQAMQMFVAQGIKSVRMDDIAQQLGVSKRTLYELFGDKEGLLYLAMVCYSDRNGLRWERMCVGAVNVLEAMFIVLRDVLAQSEVTNRILDTLRKFHPAVYDKLMHEGSEKSRSSVRTMLEQGIAEGLFINNFNIDLFISMLFYTATALVRRSGIVLPEGLSEQEAFIQIVSNSFRGISTARGLQLVDDYLKRYELGKNSK
ncbi:MAG: TetR/AcrR family transcriptional regulator [Alistipes sp.]